MTENNLEAVETEAKTEENNLENDIRVLQFEIQARDIALADMGKELSQLRLELARVKINMSLMGQELGKTPN